MAAITPQKRIFYIISVLFILLMVYFTYEFMSSTTHPGQKGQLKTRIQKRLGSDSTASQ